LGWIQFQKQYDPNSCFASFKNVRFSAENRTFFETAFSSKSSLKAFLDDYSASRLEAAIENAEPIQTTTKQGQSAQREQE